MAEQTSPASRMRSYLQLVATGPELSKSLNVAQTEDAVSIILGGQCDPIQAGIFLIALRMKRETDDENIGALNALIKCTDHVVADVPEVLAVADPFNGYARGIPATPFLPAVLAACGLPAYCHGVKQAGPKYGVTINQVMKAAGKSVESTSGQVAQKLSDPDIGWAYIDQACYAPSLHQLIGLRDTMVKRTCFSTLEVVLKPVSGRQKTHLMTGFVHKAYPPVYTSLARAAGFESAMIIRGVEGGCIPSLSQVSRYFSYNGTGEMKLNKLSPNEIDIVQDDRSIKLPEQHEIYVEQSCLDNAEVLTPVVEQTIEMGMAALSGKSGLMYDSLVYSGAIGLFHTGICNSLQSGAAIVRKKLDTGEALDRFRNG